MRASVRFAYIASRCAAECCGNASPIETDDSSSQRMSGCCSSALSEASVSASKSAAYCASGIGRSEEHTSELQSRLHLVCRLLLEKKKSALRSGLYHVRLPSY